VEADTKLRAGVEVAGAIVETAKEGAAASVSQNLHRQLIKSIDNQSNRITQGSAYGFWFVFPINLNTETIFFTFLSSNV
jgi:hypothetical protein